MKLHELLLEAIIDYTLDNYKEMPKFSDTNLGIKFKLGDKAKVMIVTNESASRLFRKYRPGTIVRILGSIVSEKSSMHKMVVNPIGTNDVYSINTYYLQDPKEPLSKPIPRLKKVLTGNLKCGNCGRVFSLSIPGFRHRDHCPFCLYSVHIDNRPGDRAAWCGTGTEGVEEGWIPSKLVPIGTKVVNGAPSIVYKCEKCGAIKINKYAPDDNKNLINKLIPDIAIGRRKGRTVILQDI